MCHPLRITTNLTEKWRLMSRRTRTLLLTATNLLYPKAPESVTKKLKLKRQKAKWYHDRSSRSLREM